MTPSAALAISNSATADRETAAPGTLIPDALDDIFRSSF
jgi:hypothetical protein